MIYSLGDRQLLTKGDHWIADNATIVGSVVLENNVSVWFNVVIRADNDTITIGENSNIQDGSVLHTDTGVPLMIGANVTVGHKVMLHGCTIGDNTLIGINAVVLNHAKIGKNCIIGANALITERQEIPDNSLVMGSPAKVVKMVSEEQTQKLQVSTLHYVENFKRYQEQLKQHG